MSEGTLGEPSALLNLAAVQAIRTGREKIDETLLAAIDWVPPSRRSN